MDVITWTGATACQLQAAYRMTNEAFAERLGVHRRTVGDWHARPGIEPRQEIQAALDTLYEKADQPVRLRFARLAQPAAVQSLRVAIAVVAHEGQVLLVCARDGEALRWQFPAGVIKPGRTAAAVAVAETRAETGVHCAVVEPLGSRVHPETGVSAEYLLCEYLAGEAANLDQVENAEAMWVPIKTLTRFIPADRIYPPILTALEAHA